MKSQNEHDRDVFDYVSAIQSGLSKSLNEFGDVLLHPYDNAIVPVSKLTYDVTVILASHAPSWLETESVSSNNQPNLNKIEAENIPEYIHKLFDDVSEVEPFLARFDAGIEKKLEQDNSDLSKALLREVRTVRKLQQHNLFELQKLNTAQERMERIHLAQDVAQASGQIRKSHEDVFYN